MLINADSSFYDSTNETTELEGNIQIVVQGQHLKADKARIYRKSRQVELYGNVEIMDARNTISGNRVFMDYENNTGVIYNGSVQSGSVMFSGNILQKTSDNEYLVLDAEYTSCTNCAPTWSFGGTSIKAEMGGYAYVKNAVLRFWDFPIFWFPYLVVPLKSDRQSGLLTPSFEASGIGGLALSVPYFWAISENTDATFEYKEYSLRGSKGLLEYRYVLDKDSYGHFRGASIYDKAFAKEDRLNLYRAPNERDDALNRWFINYEHYLVMPDGGVHRADINLTRDLQYPKDFNEETLRHGDAALENRVSYTKNSDDAHMSIDSSYYINLLHGNPLSGNDDAVHRIPELRYSSIQKSIGDTNFIYSFDLNYSNFIRSGSAYDDMSEKTLNGSLIRYPKNSCDSEAYEDDPTCRRISDGIFNPEIDQIRTGQRIDFKPMLYYPIKISEGIGLLPKLSYRETHYNFNIDDDAYLVRRFLRVELSARANISRIFGDTVNPKATRYKHEIVPEVTFSRLPWYEQREHPFFGSGSLSDAPFSTRDTLNDLDIASDYGVQFDYNDRVYDRNLVTFSLMNKITEKRWLHDNPHYRQIGYLRLSQSYDASQSSPYDEPWSNIQAILDVRLDRFQTYSILNYYPYQNVTNTSSRVRVLNDRGQFAQVALTRQYKITPGQEVDRSARQEDYTFSAGFTSRYFNLMGKVVYDANWHQAKNSDQFKSWAYISQFKPPGDCLIITFIHERVIGRDDNVFRLSFDFNFDGNPKPALPPETLDRYGMF